MENLYTRKNFGDTDLADRMNESQIKETNALANAMRVALDEIIEGLPGKLAEINELMDAMPDLNLGVVDYRKISDGAYEIVTSGLTHTGKVKQQYFRIQYAGHKAPHHYDIFTPEMAAWGEGLKLMYSGLVSAQDVPRDLAVFTHRMQIPGTVMCRY